MKLEPNPNDLLKLIGFVYSFKAPSLIYDDQFDDLGLKRITGFNFHISGIIEIALSEIDDLSFNDKEYYDLSSLVFSSVPNGNKRDFSLPYFTIPVEYRLPH